MSIAVCSRCIRNGVDPPRPGVALDPSDANGREALCLICAVPILAEHLADAAHEVDRGVAARSVTAATDRAAKAEATARRALEDLELARAERQVAVLRQQQTQVTVEAQEKAIDDMQGQLAAVLGVPPEAADWHDLLGQVSSLVETVQGILSGGGAGPDAAPTSPAARRAALLKGKGEPKPQ